MVKPISRYIIFHPNVWGPCPRNTHIDQANVQLGRDIRPLPRLKLNASVNDLFAFTFDDIMIEDYNPHPPIQAPIAV